MTRALLITNPAAARTDARAVTAIRDTLRGGGWEVEVVATARPGDARRFAAEARGQGCDVLVCYGGDGTAMQVAAGIAGSDIPLGLVPGGTGNLLAGNLRLPRRGGAGDPPGPRGAARPGGGGPPRRGALFRGVLRHRLRRPAHGRDRDGGKAPLEDGGVRRPRARRSARGHEPAAPRVGGRRGARARGGDGAGRELRGAGAAVPAAGRRHRARRRLARRGGAARRGRR